MSVQAKIKTNLEVNIRTLRATRRGGRYMEIGAEAMFQVQTPEGLVTGMSRVCRTNGSSSVGEAIVTKWLLDGRRVTQAVIWRL